MILFHYEGRAGDITPEAGHFGDMSWANGLLKDKLLFGGQKTNPPSPLATCLDKVVTKYSITNALEKVEKMKGREIRQRRAEKLKLKKKYFIPPQYFPSIL